MRARWMWLSVGLAVVVFACSAWGYDDAADRKVRQVLEETIVSFVFDKQPVDEVADYLSTVGKINVVLDKNKLVPGQTVTLKLNNVTLGTAVKFLADGIGMKYVVRDGVVVISDEEGTRQEPVTRVYDVLDLVADIPEFEGPNFELGQLSSSGSRGGSSGGTSIWNDSSTSTNEDGKGPSLQERTDALVELIKTVIEPGTWEEGGY